MPQKRVTFADFDSRLWVSGGREQIPETGLRRARGVAPELTRSVMSRWGMTGLYQVNAISVFKFNGHRYAYDGFQLFQDGAAIVSNFDGTRLTFATMPPQLGLPDYLFILGGGLTPFKIAPDGTITRWGIVAPPDQMQAVAQATETLTIDALTASAASYTGFFSSPFNCAIADGSGNGIPVGGGDLQIVADGSASGHHWWIARQFGSPQNLAQYADTTISLPTDLISIWVNVAQPLNVNYLSFSFDVNDKTFTKDYYQCTVALVANTTVPQAGQIDLVVPVAAAGWTHIQMPKSIFRRVGSSFNLDWSNVVAIWIQGGCFNGSQAVFLNDLTLTGGYALGTGPFATSGATYLYQVTFGNSTTGSDSNPNLQPVIISGVREQPVLLNQIPISSDPQVSNRKLWRSSALPSGTTDGPRFFLDIIPDNTTTTYTDKIADNFAPITINAWTASAAYAAGFLVDGGDGYYFKVTTPGTSGTTPPNWNVPAGQWIGLTNYSVGDSIAVFGLPYKFTVSTAGKSGINIPNFKSVAPAGTITDGTVVWTNSNSPTTTDGGVTWTFQGINSVQTLGNMEVLNDNAPPDTTYGDSAGPFQGGMVWTRDSASGQQDNVYFSPPGRPESVGLVYHIDSTDDPAEKAVIWDGGLWVFTTKRAMQFTGTYPAFTASPVDDGMGTSWPFTVVPVDRVGVIYRAPDGPRLLNWAGSRLIGFQNLAPLFRGQGAETLPPFYPVWAAIGRGEVFFGDNQYTLALTFDQERYVWRQLGVPLQCAYYERDTGSILAGIPAFTILYEEPGSTTDVQFGTYLRVAQVSMEVLVRSSS